MSETIREGLAIELEIVDIAPDGSGIGRPDAPAAIEFRVIGAAPGDRIAARIEHVARQRRLAFCRVIEARQRGPRFVAPICIHALQCKPGRCGGCSLMHLTAEAQLEVKAQLTRTALGDFAPRELQVEPSPTLWGYRNRASYVIARSRSGGVELGSFAPGSHRFARMDECHVVRRPIRQAAERLAQMLGAHRFPIGDEENGLSHVTLRASAAGEILVEWTAAAGHNVDWSGLAQTTSALAGVVGVSASETASGSNAVRGLAPRHLVGRPTVVETVGELALEVSASTFTQLNSDVAAAMYARSAEWALELCGPGDLAVWDLYCGVGGLGLTVARALAGSGATAPRSGTLSLFGAESSPAAVKNAKRNAQTASVEASFVAVDLEQEVPASWPKPGLVLVNPPRKGLTPAVLQRIGSCAAPILYMSCNAETLARDLAALQGQGFTLQRLAAYDMLPQTPHVELLAAILPF